MGRIAETSHTRAQEGAMFGSQTSFFRSQIEFQKGVILGPYKFDVGDLKNANKGSIFGGGVWNLFRPSNKFQNLDDVKGGYGTYLGPI